MSLYKNIGPITFIDQNNKCQIFKSQQYWLIQLKYDIQKQRQVQKRNTNMNQFLYCISQSSKLLENMVIRYNKYTNDSLLSIYTENGKMPSILLNRHSIQLWNLETQNKNIQNLCLICKSLVKSFEIFGVKNYPLTIDRNLLFYNFKINQIFYLPIQGQFQNQATGNDKRLIQLIVEFLQTNFKSQMHISYKLLIKKLKICRSLQQIRQQIDYFQKVYQIGCSNKKKQYNRPSESRNQNQIIKKHRLYRKKSSQIDLQNTHQKFTKKIHSSCSNRQSQKRTLNLLNINKYSQSLHGNSKQSFSPFVNRNKSSKAIHTSSNRYYYGALSINKGHKKIFSSSKNGNKYHNKIATSTNKKFLTFSNSNMSKKLNNYMNNITNTTPIKSTTFCSSHQKLQYNKISKQTQYLQRQTNNLTPIQQPKVINTNLKLKQNELVDQKTMQQVLKNNLDLWKNKRKNNNNVYNLIKKSQQSSKSLKRKHKTSKIDSQKDMKNLDQFIDQIKNQRISKKNSIAKITQIQNINNNQAKKVHEKERKSIIQQNQIQQITLINRTKNKDQQQTIRQNSQKQNPNPKDKMQFYKNRDSNKTQQVNLVKNTEKSDKNKIKHQLQKEKTTRKCPRASSVLEQNIIKNTKNKLQVINYVGQCVTKTPHFLSSELNNGDKYFWQLPAYLMYKQFYRKRLQIQQNLKKESLSLKTQKAQVAKLIKEIEQQNNETKQSLIRLLKVTLKKIQKFNMDAQTFEQAKCCLNLDLSQNLNVQKKAYEIILNFIIQLEQIREQKPNLLTYQIIALDAFLILVERGFNEEARKLINVENYESEDVKIYYNNRIKQLSNYVNNLAEH